ncbi:DUF4350 domain-containing protein [Chloroflexota bacterium]
MKVSTVLLPVVVLTLIISLLCIWFYPSVQDFMAGNKMWNGINNFSDDFAADNVDSLDRLPVLPEKTALVAIPYLGYTNEELSKVKQFVNYGGTLLLMDDYGYGNDVLAYLDLNTRFSNKPLLDPLFCYKNQRMPRITDFAPDVKENGISVIMLNHATTLFNTEKAQLIAWSSAASFLDIDENESQSQDESNGPFPIAAKFQFGKGVIFAISDPSIVIDSMVSRDDNYRFIEYLTGDNGEQKHIMVDRSHLSKTPLDTSKIRLNTAREVMRSPHALIGITAVIFVIVFRYTLWKGGTIGKH